MAGAQCLQLEDDFPLQVRDRLRQWGVQTIRDLAGFTKDEIECEV